MNTVKILHTADIHLDSPLKSLALRDPDLREQVQTATRAAFSRIVSTAITEEVTALLIAGDLFDGTQRSASIAAYLTIEFDRLRAAGIRVFYIKGNHDAENPLTGALDLPDNVHVFDGRGSKVQLTDQIWIHGVSFASHHAPESLLPKFPAPVPAAINIAMLHTSLAGAAGHDAYAPCSLSDLQASGFDYWALGHVHRRQIHAQTPWVVMPGMPQGRDIGESGPKSATLLTISDKIELTEIPTSVIEFRILSIDITDTEEGNAIRDLIREKLRQTATELTADKAVIRVELLGQAAHGWQFSRDQDIWTETIAEIARETEKLWLDKVLFTLAEKAISGTSATDELAELMASIQEEPGFTSLCIAEVEQLQKELTSEQRQELLRDEAARAQLVQSLSKAGAEYVLAQMKGANA